MKRFEIINRHGLKIIGLLETKSNTPKGTCVIEHGWGSNRNKGTVQAIKNAFLESGFQTFNFDATHSFGESDGDFQKSSLGTFWEDFEDVANWVKTQDWFVAPLAVSGHSKGGYAATRFAEEYPNGVGLAVPIAPVVSGELSFEAYREHDPETLAKWEKEGTLTRTGSEGDIKIQHWSQFLERLNHNLLQKASALTMPILFVVGSKDTSCPPKHIQKLFDDIPGTKKSLAIIEGAPHSFHKNVEDQEKCKAIIEKWLKNQR
jgi:alpha-beta hydrolase superfamily lysophospholipase